MSATKVGVPTNPQHEIVDTGTYAAYITDLSTTSVLTVRGKVAQLLVSGVGTTWQLAIYDNAAAGSGNLIWTWVTADGKQSIPLQCPVANGITIVSSGTTAGSAVLVFS